jgi:predicted transcriptional regulator
MRQTLPGDARYEVYDLGAGSGEMISSPKRTLLELRMGVLEKLTEARGPREISRKENMSWSVLQAILEDFANGGFVSHAKKEEVYQVTEKGVRLLNDYARIVELLGGASFKLSARLGPAAV